MSLDSDDEGGYCNGNSGNGNGNGNGGRKSISNGDRGVNGRLASLSLRTDCKDIVSYRVGSVGDDTQLLLWDIDEDILKPQRVRTRSTRAPTTPQSASGGFGWGRHAASVVGYRRGHSETTTSEDEEYARTNDERDPTLMVLVHEQHDEDQRES